MPKSKPATVDEYIKAAPEKAQDILMEMRSILRKVSPKAEEKIKWNTPVYEEGRILFSFSAHKSHVNFMPTRSTLDHFKSELSGYKTGKDTIQFPYDQPLPKTLIKKIALHRVRDVRENDARWMVK